MRPQARIRVALQKKSQVRFTSNLANCVRCGDDFNCFGVRMVDAIDLKPGKPLNVVGPCLVGIANGFFVVN
jgi:hypothetical protein